MGLFRQKAERKRQSTVGVNRKWRGNSVVGKKLHDALPLLKREVLDAEVEVRFKRRKYKGKQSTVTRRFRLVCVFNSESGKYLFNQHPGMYQVRRLRFFTVRDGK